MKTRAIFACALLAGMFTACNNNENAPETDGFVKGQHVTIEANIAGQDKDAKKIQGKLQGDKLNFIWEEGDVIDVTVGDEEPQQFVLQSGAGTGSARFEGEMPETGTQYTVKVPCADLTSQSYLPEGLASKLMAFETPTPGTLRGFTLAPQNAIFKLELASNDGKKVKQVVLTNVEDGATYTLTCAEAVELTTTPACFMLAVAPATWAKGFSVKVLGGEDGTEVLAERASTKAATFAAGQSFDMQDLFGGLYKDADGNFHITSAEGLVKFSELAPNTKFGNKTVFIEANIDMTGKEWTPIVTNDAGGHYCSTFDGKDHVISNLKINDYTGTYAGFFSTVAGATIKNITFENATVTNASSNEGARGAVIVGWSYACNIDNCHVINSSVTGNQKVAGILGGMSVEGAVGLNSVTNCSVDGLTLGCNIPDDVLYQAGALVGYIQLVNANPDGVLIENNSVKDITINDAFGGPNNTAWYSGTFIGSILRKQQIDGQKIVLKNNTISGTNTELYKSIYSSDYFGWATNAENYDGAIAPIVIDGQEWTPNYPFQIVDGGKYPTLAAALTAAQAGQTVQILQAGEYTVQTLSTNAAVVEATVEGVVFNRTPGGWVAAQTDNVKTVKNITWNVGNGGYQYFSNTNLENCTVNGILFTHMTNKFKDCTFINEEGYNFWIYGNVYTEFDNCTFTCPGKNDGVAGCGGAFNCYNEAAQTPTPILVVKNCTFTAKEASNKYSAMYIKPQTAFDIRITNSTCNDKFCTGAISGSKLWNLTSDREGTTVTIDNVLVYPFCSKDANGDYHIANATGLLQFHDLYAAGNVAHTAKVYLENDIDFDGLTWTACDWHADNATKGFALFDGQNHTIKNFTVSGQGMFYRWGCTATIGATPYFKNIVFDNAKNTTSMLNVSLFCGQVYQDAKIENVTIKNSEFEGTYKVAPFVGTVYDENGTKPTLTLKDCKVENTTVKGTSQNKDICGMVAWVYENNGDKIAFEGNNVVEDVTLFKIANESNMFAYIYHNGTTAYNEATNVTVTNVHIVPAE